MGGCSIGKSETDADDGCIIATAGAEVSWTACSAVVSEFIGWSK